MIAPVSACLIVRNESARLESCLKSVRPYVAELCIVDTGSTDSTPDIARKYADKFEVFTECNDSEGRIEDFSMARQRSFSLATQPWIFWVDGDDEVRGLENLHSIVAERDAVRGASPVQVMFPYEYAHDSAGKVICLHYRERLMSPKEAFSWQNAVHEVVTCNRPGLIQTRSDLVTVVHRRDGSGKPMESGRNLRILKKMYEKHGESDARHLYYLGLEYGNTGDFDSAMKFLTRYIDLSGWDDEKYMACLKIIEHLMARGAYEEAVRWCTRATTIHEKWGEAYFQLAKCYYFIAKSGNQRRNWERCAHFAKLGLALQRTDTVLFVNPLERDVEIHKYLNVALNAIGDVRGALSSTLNGLQSCPGEGSLDFNRKIYEKHIALEDARSCLDKLRDIGAISQTGRSSIESILEGKLPPLHDRPAYTPSAKPDGSSDGLDITIYVGRGVEAWNPETARTKGIGGSETAVAEMAPRLARLGHRVTVYGHCIRPDGESIEGNFEGVSYVDSARFGPHDCDVLLTSRRPEAVDASFGVRAKVRMCWVHDVHCGDALTHERALKIDRFLTLTNWHRDFFLRSYPFVHGSQVTVTRNGIDLSRFSGPPRPRNPHRAIYSSSPDRGMQVAIQIWPQVRKSVPDAELHIYYGFDVWEACSQGNPGQLELIAHLKKLIADHAEHGVVHHGRVDQKTLADEYMVSGVWAYPTWFSETSCQLAGTSVSTFDGMKPIEDISIGDMVLTHKGRFRRVTELVCKNYEGLLYSVKRKKDFRPITLTAEHPLWVRRNGEFEWLSPGEITPETDFLFTPEMEFGSRESINLSDYVDMPVVGGEICRRHDHPVYKPTSNKVDLNEDVMFILGLFAADGHAGWNAKRNAPGAITFALHKTTKSELIERSRQFFSGHVRQTSDNGVVVTAYCAPWAVFLRKVIGVGRGKRIPSFVWECSKKLQQAFLDGMFAGDGSTSTTPRGNGKVTAPYKFYTSVSPSLAYGCAQLLTNLGFHPGISYSKERDAYTLNWSDRRAGWHEFVDGGVVTKVESVRCEHYDGPVYNFEVEEDRSYVTDRTAVHNCITAMEAQAAGLAAVTSPIAALNETVGPRGTMVHGDWLTKPYQEAFVAEVVRAMLSTTDERRKEVRDYAFENFGWDGLAQEWDKMFRQVLSDVVRDVVPQYQPAR